MDCHILLQSYSMNFYFLLQSYTMDCSFLLQSFSMYYYFLLQSYFMECYFLLQSYPMVCHFLLQSYSMDCYFRQSWVDQRLTFSGYKATTHETNAVHNVNTGIYFLSINRPRRYSNYTECQNICKN